VPGTLKVLRGSDILPTRPSDAIMPLWLAAGMFEHYSIQSVFRLPAAVQVSCMLATSAYQALVTNLEREFLRQRKWATQVDVDNEAAFLWLTNLRRELTNTHEHMARTSSSVDDALVSSKSHTHRGPEAPDQYIKTLPEHATSSPGDEVPEPFSAAGSWKQRPADLSKLSETFSELDARLRAVIAALNDEIQIVIGSVQIQDAKAMKRQADLTMQLTESTMRQTEVSVRQTRWTVALAVLAALYLPMTLVTGIFGMNIKEVTGGEGPNWWWVIVTWAIAMGMTVGCVGRYALAEWEWYRQGMQEPKAAAKQDPTKGISGVQNHGLAKSARHEANQMGRSSITRRKKLWWKLAPNSQHNGTRSSV